MTCGDCGGPRPRSATYCKRCAAARIESAALERRPQTCRDCGRPRGKFKTYCDKCYAARRRKLKGCEICGGPKERRQGVRRCATCSGVPGPWRRCDGCEQLKSVGAGQIKAKGHVCMDCQRERKRQYGLAFYSEHREEVAAKVRDYRARDRDAYNARRRDYYAANRDRYRKSQAAYRAKPENREIARQRSAEWYRMHTDLSLQRSAEWYANNREAVLRHHRNADEREKRDPVRRAKRRENQRFSARLRAEQQGRPMAPVSEEVYVKRYGDGKSKAGSLPVAPILELLAGFDELTAGRMCEELGIHRHRVLSSVDRISLVTADRICVYLGVPLSLVYQEAA